MKPTRSLRMVIPKPRTQFFFVRHYNLSYCTRENVQKQLCVFLFVCFIVLFCYTQDKNVEVIQFGIASWIAYKRVHYKIISKDLCSEPQDLQSQTVQHLHAQWFSRIDGNLACVCGGVLVKLFPSVVLCHECCQQKRKKVFIFTNP